MIYVFFPLTNHCFLWLNYSHSSFVFWNEKINVFFVLCNLEQLLINGNPQLIRGEEVFENYIALCFSKDPKLREGNIKS